MNYDNPEKTVENTSGCFCRVSEPKIWLRIFKSEQRAKKATRRGSPFSNLKVCATVTS
jgi:hypothetical protein